MQKKDDENQLISFSKSLPQVSENTVRVFQRQENEWACLEQHSELLAQTVYKTSSAIRKIGNSLKPMCSVNLTLLKMFLLDCLQNRGLRVELFELESGSRLKWKQVAKEASPGNLLAIEDFLDTNTDQSPVIMAVKPGNAPSGEKIVGVCFADAESRKLGLSQFSDNDLFSNLESTVIQLGVKEVILPDDQSPEVQRICDLLARLDILATKRKSSFFNSKDASTDLTKLTGESAFKLQSSFDQELAMAAANCVVKFLGLVAHPSNFGQFEVLEHNLDQYMKLDAAALRALNVMPTSRDGNKNMSLFGLLNQCKTTSGTRLLAQWVKQPLMDQQEIEKRLDLVEEFMDNVILRSRIQDDLMPAVPDLSKIQRKFNADKAKLEDVVNVYHLAIRLPEFIEDLSESTDLVKQVYVEPIMTAKLHLAKLVELVETTVDLQALERHEFVVKADFDDHLVALKAAREKCYRQMETELERVGQELDTDKVKLENNVTLGWAFRLTRTDAGCLRNKTGFIDLKTQKSGQFFTTKQLRELAMRHQELGEQYHKAQFAVAKQVVGVAGTYIPVLGPLGAILAHLDVILSFAQVSAFAKLPYVRPKFTTEAKFELVQARHPCMEVQPDMMFIPNDVRMDKTSSSFNIITGPNMGGKSTYIRQVGVISHLAQIGCFVPCESAELAIVDCVLARVGASDSQLKGISTFMAEMLETASILKTATNRSLIIIDELGRGTSTYDGFGLAWAISQHIIDNIGSWCLFATHFHELTALAEKYEQVANLHVVANSEDQTDDITLLYKVEPGISERSFGIHVAEVVHFPAKVVKMAKRKAFELENLDQFDNDECESGKVLVKSVLAEWSASLTESDTESTKLEKLRARFEECKPQIEQNKYLHGLLESL